jgi:hypothetical protein
MAKIIAFKDVRQWTALATGTLALTPLVIEVLEDFKGASIGCACGPGPRRSRRCRRADVEQ